MSKLVPAEGEAGVRVTYVANDMMLGSDVGVLFAEADRLGFQGDRSSFLIPLAAYRRDTTALNRGQPFVWLVHRENGSRLCLQPRHIGPASQAVLIAALISAERAVPTAGPVEWPPSNPLGNAGRTPFAVQRRRVLIACGVLLAFTAIGPPLLVPMSFSLMTRFMWIALMPTAYFIHATLGVLSGEPRAWYRGIARAWWLTGALLSAATGTWAALALARGVKPAFSWEVDLTLLLGLIVFCFGIQPFSRLLLRTVHGRATARAEAMSKP